MDITQSPLHSFWPFTVPVSWQMFLFPWAPCQDITVYPSAFISHWLQTTSKQLWLLQGLVWAHVQFIKITHLFHLVSDMLAVALFWLDLSQRPASRTRATVCHVVRNLLDWHVLLFCCYSRLCIIQTTCCWDTLKETASKQWNATTSVTRTFQGSHY